MQEGGWEGWEILYTCINSRVSPLCSLWWKAIKVWQHHSIMSFYENSFFSSALQTFSWLYHGAPTVENIICVYSLKTILFDFSLCGFHGNSQHKNLLQIIMPQKSASQGALNVCLLLWGMCKVSIRCVYKELWHTDCNFNILLKLMCNSRRKLIVVVCEVEVSSTSQKHFLSHHDKYTVMFPSSVS